MWKIHCLCLTTCDPGLVCTFKQKTGDRSIIIFSIFEKLLIVLHISPWLISSINLDSILIYVLSSSCEPCSWWINWVHNYLTEHKWRVEVNREGSKPSECWIRSTPKINIKSVLILNICWQHHQLKLISWN